MANIKEGMVCRKYLFSRPEGVLIIINGRRPFMNRQMIFSFQEQHIRIFLRLRFTVQANTGFPNIRLRLREAVFVGLADFKTGIRKT